jgi:hypothetical protein
VQAGATQGTKPSLREVYASLDKADVPEDFHSDRDTRRYLQRNHPDGVGCCVGTIQSGNL